MDQTFAVRDATPDDAGPLASIYNHYVRTSVATFAEAEITDAESGELLHEARAADLPWLVATSDSEIAGYAHATKWKGRCAYRHTVEVTVYLAPTMLGHGIGTMLYEALLPRLSSRDLHAVIGGISLPNEASIALHERFGFEKVAHFREVGHKFGRWIDVGYWQLVLEPETTVS